MPFVLLAVISIVALLVLSGEASAAEGDAEASAFASRQDESIGVNAGGTYMLHPLDAPLRITSGFGRRQDPMTGTPSEQFHPGVDLGASLGSPVYAVDDGTVVASYLSVGRETDKSKAYYGWGNRIVLRHDSADHPFTEYNHMMMRTAQQAESVVKGQIIGFVGSTGASTGPHLHFGVVAVDPQTTAYAESNYIDPTNLIG